MSDFYHPTYNELSPYGKCLINEFIQQHKERIRDGIPPSITFGYNARDNSPEMNQAQKNVRDLTLAMIGIKRLEETLKASLGIEAGLVHYCKKVHQPGGPYLGEQTALPLTIKPISHPAQREAPPRR